MVSRIIEELIKPRPPAAFAGGCPILRGRIPDDPSSLEPDSRDEWFCRIEGKLGNPDPRRFVRPTNGQAFASRGDGHRTRADGREIGWYRSRNDICGYEKNRESHHCLL